MSRIFGLSVVVLAVTLTGCRTTGQGLASQTLGNTPGEEPNAVKLCERVLYGETESNLDQTLACAHALDIWQ